MPDFQIRAKPGNAFTLSFKAYTGLFQWQFEVIRDPGDSSHLPANFFSSIYFYSNKSNIKSKTCATTPYFI
jgi:hypothetical protein